MKILSSDTSISSQNADLLALGVREGALDSLNPALEQAFDGRLASSAREEEFSGKVGTSVSWPTFGRLAAGRLMLVGLGDGSPDALRRAAGAVGFAARGRGARQVAMDLGALSQEQTLAAVEGFLTGNYRFEPYKPAEERKAEVESLRFLSQVSVEAVALAEAIAAGQRLARDVVNEIPEKLYPATLAAVAEGLACDGLTVEVWDEEKIRAAGMGGITAVGQGSPRGARFVHMRWSPPGGSSARLAVIGKGVTFDSGGLSLKPSSGMQTMRCDMGGSAAVIGLMRALRDLKPAVEVHAIFGAVENMPDGLSYKLGDVLTMYNGKTVEVHNTDAEGRLVLADCLTYASRLQPDAMIDLATLTGACVVALGEHYSGLFTADDALAGELLRRADEAGESVWRLPLAEVYREKLKADWAGMKNVGGREGGAITAALFLSEFVEGVPWAHLDIAGPAFLEKPFRHFAAGGTGALVPTLVRWVLARQPA